MGFDVNFNNNQPMIKQSQGSQDGGAGNLGYFQAGGDEEKKRQQRDKSIFSEQKDDFVKEGEEKEDFSLSKFIAEIIYSVRAWLKKIFKI